MTAGLQHSSFCTVSMTTTKFINAKKEANAALWHANLHAA